MYIKHKTNVLLQLLDSNFNMAVNMIQYSRYNLYLLVKPLQYPQALLHRIFIIFFQIFVQRPLAFHRSHLESLAAFLQEFAARSVGVASATNITNSAAMKNDKIFIINRLTKPAVLKPK